MGVQNKVGLKMKFIFLVPILAVFSLVGTSFALTPVYYSENKCDIEKDLKNYRELLRNDVIVQTFLQKYPDTITVIPSAIDDSGGQVNIQYKHDDGVSKTQLTVQIIGYRETTHECFVPFSHVLNYSEHDRHFLIESYEDQTQEILDFLNGVKNQTPIIIKQVELSSKLNSDSKTACAGLERFSGPSTQWFEIQNISDHDISVQGFTIDAEKQGLIELQIGPDLSNTISLKSGQKCTYPFHCAFMENPDQRVSKTQRT